MRLAVTLGDPAGIGPEVVEGAAQRLFLERDDVELVLVGPAGIADAMAAALGGRASALVQERFSGPVGEPSAASGQAALAALHRAIDEAEARRVDALVTAPLSKQALALAGSADRGHTEILARRLGRGPVAMAFFSERLQVVLATVHLPLCEAIAAITEERVVQVSELFHAALQQRLHKPAPRLALCGLNPHAGEGGLLGHEEQDILVPAVAEAARRGIALCGPYPADSLFFRAAAGEYDGVVALYHDQGLIPVKLLAFGNAVNVTLGLQLPRTSPDHGTAYDIAGRKRARPDGMLAALRTACELVGEGRHTPGGS